VVKEIEDNETSKKVGNELKQSDESLGQRGDPSVVKGMVDASTSWTDQDKAYGYTCDFLRLARRFNDGHLQHSLQCFFESGSGAISTTSKQQNSKLDQTTATKLTSSGARMVRNAPSSQGSPPSAIARRQPLPRERCHVWTRVDFRSNMFYQHEKIFRTEFI